MDNHWHQNCILHLCNKHGHTRIIYLLYLQLHITPLKRTWEYIHNLNTYKHTLTPELHITPLKRTWEYNDNLNTYKHTLTPELHITPLKRTWEYNDNLNTYKHTWIIINPRTAYCTSETNMGIHFLRKYSNGFLTCTFAMTLSCRSMLSRTCCRSGPYEASSSCPDRSSSLRAPSWAKAAINVVARKGIHIGKLCYKTTNNIGNAQR